VVPCGLPPGLKATFSSLDVTIAGTPTQAGDWLVAFQVTDASAPQQTAMRTFTLSIKPNTPTLKITTTSLPNGTVGTSYSASIDATGGTTPYTWTNVGLGCPTVMCGLPPGLTATFNATSVSISGTPTTAGQFIVVYS